MKRYLIIFTLAAIALSCAAVARAQTAATAATSARASQHLIGEVTAVDTSSSRITVKTDAGSTVNVTTDEHTIYRRVPPGQTSLASAETITSADVHAGDRVLVPNAAAGGQARQVIVMARDAIASKRAQEQQDWRARGTGGRVAAVDPAKKEITVESRSREGAEKVTVAADGNVRFLRYAPDSLSQADAVPGAFSDIRIGDQVRVLGNRNGARVTAEQVVSGSVTRLMGTIESVDAARNELTVKDANGKTFNVAVGAHTTLRRMTAEAAQAMAQRAEQRQRDSASQPGQNGAGDRAGRREGGGDSAGARRGAGGDGAGRQRGFGGGQQGMFGNLPATTLAELKKGDGVIITGTNGADATRLTAASLVAGDAELVQRMQQRRRGPGGGQRGAGAGMPGGGPGEGGGNPDRP